MPDYNDLEGKLEAAWQQVIIAAAVGTDNVFTGQDNAAEVLPKVSIHAQSGEEIARGSNFYKTAVELTVESVGFTEQSGTDPLPAHRTLVAKVRDAALQSDIADLLNTAADELDFELSVIDVLDPTPTHTVSDRTRFTDTLTLQVVAASADIME